MNIKLVEYQSNHYQDLRELVKQLQLFEAKINKYRSTSDDRFDQITREIIERVIKKEGIIFLAMVNDEMVGFVSFYLDDDVLNTNKYVYVSDLVVKEAYRKQGIAKKLMDKAEEFSQLLGLTTIRVAVLENNSSRNFYHKLGFMDETVELVKEIV